MKATQIQIDTIKEQFKSMNCKKDFLDLLNTAKQVVYGEKAIPFSEKQLNYYINKNSSHSNPCYISFTIKKKSGANRTLHAPIKGLKELQTALNTVMQCVYEPHKAATGFVVGKSIVDNAKLHIDQNYVYNLDLKDFFSSVDKSRVWGRMLITPFNLGTSDERKKIANMIAGLSCTLMEVERFENNEWTKKNLNVLPQGAPTSPTLTNAICEKLDIRLTGIAKRFGLNYSRYADDITFSSKHNSYEFKKGFFENIYVKNGTFDTEVRKVIASQNFHIKESKVRLQKRGYRQEVSGLLVNDKINVSRKYTQLVRKWIYLWETYGYEKATVFFIKKYIADKGHTKKGNPNMMNVIDGKLLYLKMVKGETDSSYMKLKERFDKLTGKNDHIEAVLSIWETQGIEKAMEVYYVTKPNETVGKIATNEELDKIFNLL